MLDVSVGVEHKRLFRRVQVPSLTPCDAHDIGDPRTPVQGSRQVGSSLRGAPVPDADPGWDTIGRVSGNKRVQRRQRIQRITVYVIIAVVVMSLSLSLLTSAGAFGLSSRTTTPRGSATPQSVIPEAVAAPGPTPSDPAGVGSTDDPLPVTKTPQGTATQVTDTEHIGGIVAYLVFMVGGLLLLVRSGRRQPREEQSEPILS